jgi:hypothetical protein
MLIGYYSGLSVFSVGFCVSIELFLLFMSGVGLGVGVGGPEGLGF